MNRRLGVLAALVLFVSLAGCSALPVWDEGGTDTTPEADGATPTPTATPTPAGESSDSVPSADPDADPGEAPADAAYPDGYGPSGVTDAGTAAATHLDALTGYDGYIFSYDSLIQEGEANTTFTYQQIVDRDDERAYVIQDTGEASQVSYFEDDRVYIRVESGDEVRYNDSDRAYNMSEFSGIQFVGPLLANVEYGNATVHETDEGTFYSYASENVTNPAAILRSDVDESEIDSFETSIVVDERGTIRRAAFVVESDRTVSVQMGFGEINDTSVDRPDWFEQANDS